VGFRTSSQVDIEVAFLDGRRRGVGLWAGFAGSFLFGFKRVVQRGLRDG
jgi:hypothetical protein